MERLLGGEPPPVGARRAPHAAIALRDADARRLAHRGLNRRRERPVVEVHPRYEWTYLYGFVRPPWLEERGLGPERRALVPSLARLGRRGWPEEPGKRLWSLDDLVAALRLTLVVGKAD